MTTEFLKIIWPDGTCSHEKVGASWLEVASSRDLTIPTGCLGGSCGACEIEVDGEVVRACVSKIKKNKGNSLTVLFADDPYW